MVDGKNREDGFNSTGCAKQMSNRPLGAAHVDFGRTVLSITTKQNPLDGVVLCGIA